MLSALFPEVCPGCGGSTDAGFCTICAAGFPAVAQPCPGCGLARPVIGCPRRTAVWSVEVVVAPLRYGVPLDHYVQALKYNGARKLGRALGLLLADGLRARAVQIDALVPVPLHPRRLRERGYNQAAEIARSVSRRLRIPLLARGIRRSRASPPQTGLDAQSRYANMASAFAVARDLRGLRLAIVDDVITTGATVNALAGALAAAGADRLEAWAVARTLPD
ncbi:MAG TPA: phosphoribosyltransferase family protein [Gammaproteobacteria bacterium]|nr:phosphoribosyltransferase family protein [Gammaproteobacteria bacterium]